MLTEMTAEPDATYNYWYWYEIRQALLRRDGCCCYCGKKLDRYTVTIDHLIPRGKGGTDDLDNLVAACKECNHEKGDMLPLDFIQKRLRKQKRKLCCA